MQGLEFKPEYCQKKKRKRKLIQKSIQNTTKNKKDTDWQKFIAFTSDKNTHHTHTQIYIYIYKEPLQISNNNSTKICKIGRETYK
jgi:hypothetical protein